MLETRFKQTEIGRIPKDWGLFKFGKALKFLPNNTFAREHLCDKGYIKDIHYGDVLIKYGSVLDASNTVIPYINPVVAATYHFKYMAHDGDVIIADTAEDEMVGKATELWNVGDSQIVAGLHTMWCHPYKGLFGIKYLGYFINCSTFHNQILPLIQGIKVSSVSKNDIQETWLLVPPLAEQERIASALTAADNLIASLGKQIAKTRNLKQATMQHLLSSLPNHSPLKPLGDFLCYEQPTKYIVKSSEYYDAGVPVLTAGQSFILGYTKEAEGIFDANVDNPVIIFDDFTTSFHWVDFNFKVKSSAMKMLRPLSKNVSFRYIYYAMSRIKYEPVEHSRQWISMYSNFTIPVPPIEEQERIASILTAMDNQIAALEAKRSKYEMVKQGMMQQLLTGTIRLT